MPRHINGQLGAAATEVIHFVEKLRAILPCPVVTWDERLTTVAAHRALREAGKKTRHTRGYVDQVARSEEHTSELQSLRHLVCRLLLEKKKQRQHSVPTKTPRCRDL